MLELPALPWIVGHRGAAGEVTENTVPSFRRAVEDGADMIELDVQLTADGELAVLHDWDLARMAGTPWQVEDTRWEDLASLRLRGPDGERRESVPRLADVLAALPADFPLDVELKRRRAERGALCGAALAAIAGRRNVMLSSFDHELLREVRRRSPAAVLAPLASEHALEALETARRLGAVSLHVATRLADRALLAAAQTAALPVLVFTVDDPDTARALFGIGVAGVFTDQPARLNAELRPRRG